MTDKAKNNNPPSNINGKDIYRIAFETRNLEINLFWQRSNYFLVLNTGLALGYFSLDRWEFSLPLSLFGLVTSILWYQVNLGSKFWQSRWEERLAQIERTVAPNFGMFSADYQTMVEDVKKSQELRPPETKFRAWLNEQILKKPSVSVRMTVLSMLFIFGWVLLIILTPLLGPE